MASSSTDSKISLAYWFVVGRFIRFWEYLRSVFRYYGNTRYRRVDLGLVANYLFENPYGVAKRFAMQKGEAELHTYGETPPLTMEEISKRCGITEDDVVYELGCGRGRSCFWMHCFLGCRVVGIEYNPHFVWKAQKLADKNKIQGVQFRCEDFFKSKMNDATVVYLYGTCLEDEFVAKVAKKLAFLPQGTTVVTVSYPLNDFCEKVLYEHVDAFEAPFTWGKAWVYVQKVL